MQYKVEKIYRRNIGGTCLVEVKDEQEIPDKCYDGCVFYQLIGDGGMFYFGKNRTDKYIEDLEIKLMKQAVGANIIQAVDYHKDYGIIMPYLSGYVPVFSVNWDYVENVNIFKDSYRKTHEHLEECGVLDQIDLHPGNVMVLMRADNKRLEQYMIIDLEPIACNRSAYTLKKIMAL